MQFTNQNPDRNVVALFKQLSVPNPGKSEAAGRPIFDDVDVCELRYPGSKNVGVYPAEGFSHWETDPTTGAQRRVSYAERFPQQYRQFKERHAQTTSGTPLDYAMFLTEARRAELRALNIYTIEALAAVDGQELKNLGPLGRHAKNQAIDYLEESNSGEAARRLKQQLDAAVARTALLEEDLRILKERKAATAEPAKAGDIFDDMTPAQLRDYITANTGHPPQGNLNRKTLLRMAEACMPTKGDA